MKKDSIGAAVTGQLEDVMNEREHILVEQPRTPPLKITGQDVDSSLPMVISPILCEGDVIGSVILRSKDPARRLGETEQALAKCAACFLGRQMEQ